LGIGNSILALFLGVLFGVAIWTVLIAIKIKKRKDYIPFGTFLTLGSVISVFFGPIIIGWYLSLFKL